MTVEQFIAAVLDACQERIDSHADCPLYYADLMDILETAQYAAEHPEEEE